MRKELVAMAAALLWTAAGLAQTDEPGDGAGDATRALERLESARESALPGDIRAHLVDKGRIGDQAMYRVIGLREAGNPHIQKGEGLLLPGIKDDPLLSRVDSGKLRAERIAMIERSSRGASATKNNAWFEGTAEEPGDLGEPATSEPEPEPLSPLDAFAIVFVVSSILLLTGGALFYLRENEKTKR